MYQYLPEACSIIGACIIAGGYYVGSRVVETFTNNGGNSGISLCNCSEAVGGFRVGRYNVQFIGTFTLSHVLQKVLCMCFYSN